MARDYIFTFRVNDHKRGLTLLLAERLQRTKSDAVRFAIATIAGEMLDRRGNQSNINTTSNEKYERNHS